MRKRWFPVLGLLAVTGLILAAHGLAGHALLGAPHINSTALPTYPWE